jgi:hypothetical protein
MQIHDNNKAKEQNKKEKMTHKSNPSKNKTRELKMLLPRLLLISGFDLFRQQIVDPVFNTEGETTAKRHSQNTKGAAALIIL